MRIWHKDLIGLLPKQQLLGQWREIAAIACNIKKHGSPNHILVNKIMQYSMSHFCTYAMCIRAIMLSYGYKVSEEVTDNILSVISHKAYTTMPLASLFYGWHDDKYLEICLRNLEEKAMCGGIPLEEWTPIVNKYKDKYDLWSGN